MERIKKSWNSLLAGFFDKEDITRVAGYGNPRRMLFAYHKFPTVALKVRSMKNITYAILILSTCTVGPDAKLSLFWIKIRGY